MIYVKTKILKIFFLKPIHKQNLQITVIETKKDLKTSKYNNNNVLLLFLILLCSRGLNNLKKEINVIFII